MVRNLAWELDLSLNICLIAHKDCDLGKLCHICKLNLVPGEMELIIGLPRAAVGSHEMISTAGSAVPGT